MNSESSCQDVFPLLESSNASVEGVEEPEDQESDHHFFLIGDEQLTEFLNFSPSLSHLTILMEDGMTLNQIPDLFKKALTSKKIGPSTKLFVVCFPGIQDLIQVFTLIYLMISIIWICLNN